MSTKNARRLLASYHDRYGDEITFIPGGVYFAPMYDTRENNRRTIHKALAEISKMAGAAGTGRAMLGCGLYGCGEPASAGRR